MCFPTRSIRPANQTWNARRYQENASFVAALGASVPELPDPQPGKSFLDLGVVMERSPKE